MFLGKIYRSRWAFALAFFSSAFAATPSVDAKESIPREEVTYADLTPGEKAIVEVYMLPVPRYRPEVNPLQLSQNGRVDSALTREWIGQLRPDSYERIVQAVPKFKELVERGRANRIRYYESLIEKFESAVEQAGFDEAIAGKITGFYSHLLAKQTNSKPPREELIKPYAEEKTRAVYASELAEILDQELKLRKELGSPTPVRSVVPVEKWPKHVRDYYERQLNHLRTSSEDREPATSLPPRIFAQWKRWASQLLEKELGKGLRPAAEDRFDTRFLSSAYSVERLRDRKNHLYRLTHLIAAAGSAPAEQRKYLEAAKKTAAEYSTLKDGAPKRIYGMPLAMNGSETPVAVPHLAFLCDLYTVEDSPEEAWKHWIDRYMDMPFWRPSVDLLLNPVSYLNKKALEIKKRAVGVLAAGLIAVGVFSVPFSIGVGLAGVDQRTPGTVQSQDVSGSGEFNPRSLSDLVSTGRLAPGDGENVVIYRTYGQATNELVFPVKEDIADSLSNDQRIPVGDVDFSIESQVPHGLIDGKYLAIPRAPGRLAQVDWVKLDSGPRLRTGIDFQLVQSAKGYQFIQFNNPDNFPSLWPSRASFMVNYYRDRSNTKTPPMPTVTTEHLERLVDLNRDAEFETLATHLEQLVQNAKAGKEADAKDLKNLIQDHALYSHVPAVKHPNPENPLKGYEEFKDNHKNFCPDCDVAASFLKDMIEQKSSADGYDYQIRASIELKDNHYLSQLMHGRLFAWKSGFQDPLILDATPYRPDPRNPSEITSTLATIRAIQSDAERAQRQKAYLSSLLGQYAYHRFRFRGQLDPMTADTDRDFEPPPPTSREEREAKRKAERKQFKASLLENIQHETERQEKQNQVQQAQLEKLAETQASLVLQLRNQKIALRPELRLPHTEALLAAQTIRNYVENKPGSDQALETLLRRSGGLDKLVENLENQVQKFQKIATQAKQKKLEKPLSPEVLDHSRQVLGYLGAKNWQPITPVDPAAIRKQCYESLAALHRK